MNSFRIPLDDRECVLTIRPSLPIHGQTRRVRVTVGSSGWDHLRLGTRRCPGQHHTVPKKVARPLCHRCVNSRFCEQHTPRWATAVRLRWQGSEGDTLKPGFFLFAYWFFVFVFVFCCCCFFFFGGGGGWGGGPSRG